MLVSGLQSFLLNTSYKVHVMSNPNKDRKYSSAAVTVKMVYKRMFDLREGSLTVIKLCRVLPSLVTFLPNREPWSALHGRDVLISKHNNVCLSFQKVKYLINKLLIKCKSHTGRMFALGSVQ